MEERRVDHSETVAGPPVALLGAGAVLGSLGDALLRVPLPPGLNLSLWVASVAVAVLLLQRRSGVPLRIDRIAWLAVGVAFAAGLAWRDSTTLKPLALGCATLVFALAAHRLTASWVRRAGVMRYVTAFVFGILHVWTASALVLLDAARLFPRLSTGDRPGWRRAAAVARGLAIAAPLVAVFGALFVAADAMFADLVATLVRFDFDWLASHVVLFSLFAWISTGYMRGFLTSTEGPFQRALGEDGLPVGLARPVLGVTEVATALASLDLLFLLFVVVQFRYLFGGDALVQVTPDLTYAEYARRGFFELVLAVCLVVPVLLAADWLREQHGRSSLVFRMLAGVQILLVLAITASAFHRLRLYHASYGLTEARLYATVLLVWIGAMLLWFGATVLRGRRNLFAYGVLTSGLATVALLFFLNPDAVVARTNVARMASMDASARFDVAYATTLSGDAVPVLIAALPALPNDVQCPLARHMLRRWPPQRERSIRAWNWSAVRATQAVREREAQLRLMVGPDQKCAVLGG